jgi:hypothetical protein
MKKTLCFATVMILFSSVHRSVDANVVNPPITWGSPTNIVGDTDVITTGTLVGAFSTGTTGVPSTTVNGVTFAPFAIPNDFAAGTTTVGNFSLHFDARFASNSAYGSTSAPFSGLSSSYESLLRSGAVDEQNSAITLTMSGLTPGRAYTFEWWSNWSTANTFALTTATATNTVSLDNNTTNLEGGLGQFAIGTFTANPLGSETITYNSTAIPFLNAFQLRTSAAPEPSSLALFAVGAGAVMFLRLCKRRVR